MIDRLSQDESQSLLSRQFVARLGCVLESGEPYVVPVNYLFKDGCIFIHSLPGLKVEALRSNSKVCVQVDNIESSIVWESAIAFGEFEELTDSAERDAIFSEMMARFVTFTPVEALVRHGGSADSELVIFRIRIRRMSGMGEG